MITEDCADSEQCWICDQHVLSIFLWVEECAIDEQHDYTESQINHYRDSKVNKESERLTRESEQPVISGPFTNWKPKKMVQIDKMLSGLSTMNIIGEKFKKLL